MRRTRTYLIALGIMLLIAGLGLLRYTSLRRRGGAGDGQARQQLKVGFLPVT